MYNVCSVVVLTWLAWCYSVPAVLRPGDGHQAAAVQPAGAAVSCLSRTLRELPTRERQHMLVGTLHARDVTPGPCREMSDVWRRVLVGRAHYCVKTYSYCFIRIYDLSICLRNKVFPNCFCGAWPRQLSIQIYIFLIFYHNQFNKWYRSQSLILIVVILSTYNVIHVLDN